MISYDIYRTPVILQSAIIFTLLKKNIVNIKNIFLKYEKRFRDVKTQKTCKQGRKIKQTTSI